MVIYKQITNYVVVVLQYNKAHDMALVYEYYSDISSDKKLNCPERMLCKPRSVKFNT